MHELAVTKQFVSTVLSECKTRGLKQLKKVSLEVGKLTTYKKDPLIFYFDSLKKGIPVLSNAVLDVKMVEGKDFNIKSINVK